MTKSLKVTLEIIDQIYINKRNKNKLFLLIFGFHLA